MEWTTGPALEATFEPIQSFVIRQFMEAYTTRRRVRGLSPVSYSFAYMTEARARSAVAARNISNFPHQVHTDFPTALSREVFDRGFNWFIVFPSNSSSSIDVVAWGRAIRR